MQGSLQGSSIYVFNSVVNTKFFFRCKTEDTNCSNNRHLWIWQHIFLCLCKDRCKDRQFTFSTQLLTLNYLIFVQLRTKEMEIKGIVTNKKEGNRKGVNFLLWYLCSLFRCKTEDTNCSNNHHLWIWQHIFLCLCKDRWCRDSVSTKQEKGNFIIPDKNAFWQ